MQIIELLKNKYPEHNFDFREYPKYLLGHCPGHDDQHPSFSVSKNGYYKCFACGFQGKIGDDGKFKELTAEEKAEIEKERERQILIFKDNLEFY
ncbi:MAG: CHC2 zinc finger domain-containing protein, partial [Deltaproteobacteria bacterium]|nr:CHC2 zinc finger domain-containing protein [Deltaproteobacteria bacterium]